MNAVTDRLIPYRAFLAQEKAYLVQQIALLETQNRQDEANMHKIRLNIFEVFETVAQADEKQVSTWEDFCLRYEPRFETLTAPWQKRLENAVRNSDTRTRFVEEIKLSTANRIRNAFLDMKE